MRPIPHPAAKQRNRRRRLCPSFTLASKRLGLVPKNPSAFPSRSSTLSDKSWRLSGSGRPEMPDAVPTANTCGIEWTSGSSLRRWRSNSTNGSRAHLWLQTLTKLQRAGTKFLTPSRFVAKVSASKHYSRFTLPASLDGAASTWTNGKAAVRPINCGNSSAGLVLHANVCGRVGRCRHKIKAAFRNERGLFRLGHFPLNECSRSVRIIPREQSG